jgi:hypothetical protein
MLSIRFVIFKLIWRTNFLYEKIVLEKNKKRKIYQETRI